MDAPYFASRTGADIYGSSSALNVARGGDIPEDRLHKFSGGLPSFYKTGYKAGSAFLKSAIGVWLWLLPCEGLMIASNSVVESGLDIPFFTFLHENVDCMPKTAQAWTMQAILFGAGLILYVLCTLLAVKISVKRYEKVDVQ